MLRVEFVPTTEGELLQLPGKGPGGVTRKPGAGRRRWGLRAGANRQKQSPERAPWSLDGQQASRRFVRYVPQAPAERCQPFWRGEGRALVQGLSVFACPASPSHQ